MSDVDEILTAYCLNPESQNALGFSPIAQLQPELLGSEDTPSLKSPKIHMRFFGNFFLEIRKKALSVVRIQ